MASRYEHDKELWDSKSSKKWLAVISTVRNLRVPKVETKG